MSEVATGAEPSGASQSERSMRRIAMLAPLALLGALVVVGAASYAVGGDWFRLLMASEVGVVENGTVLFCLLGAIVAARLALRRGEPAWTRAWWAVFAVGLLLLGGEEASWGQHWFGWTAPEGYAHLNLQRETNLHNLSKAAEQVPKTLLTIATLLTGVFWPLWHAYRRAPVHSSMLARIWPAAFLWLSATIGVVIRIVERVIAAVPDDGVEQPVIKMLKEGSELFLILYILLYLADMLRRRDAGGGPI